MYPAREQTPGREDLLLLIALGAEGGAYPFDAIRAMKGCFIVSQRGRDSWKGLYDFQPYDYGPFDPSVYRAQERLLTDGLLEEQPGRHPSYVPTGAGRSRGSELEGEMGPDADWVKNIGRWTTSRSFAQLLREVYAEYPDFATRSIASVS